jgi:hypothetical protein
MSDHFNFDKLLNHDSSKANLDYIASQVQDKAEAFAAIMEYALNGDPRIAMRASAVAERITREYPDMIHPFVDEILIRFNDFPHQGQKRNIMKIFTRMSFPEEQLGKIVDLSFSCVDNVKESIAVQAYSMEIIFNTCVEIPELRKELRFILQERQEYFSSGWQARARIFLKMLDKLT